MTDLVVMAAGMGSRYGGLKQLEHVGPSGETVMDYSVFDARRAGLDRVVFIIRRELETAFREHIGSRYTRWMKVDYAFQDLEHLPPGFQGRPQRVKPWGTGHAVLAAKHAVKGPFVVVNADDFYGQAAFQALADWAGRAPGNPVPEYALVAFQLARTLSEHGSVARGICRVAGDGTLDGVREWVGLARDGDTIQGPDGAGRFHRFQGDEPVSMNCWGFRPTLFTGLEDQFRAFLDERGSDPKAEFFLPAVIDTLIQQGRCSVKVLSSPDRWFGVTYQQDKALVEKAIQALVNAGTYPPDLWA